MWKQKKQKQNPTIVPTVQQTNKPTNKRIMPKLDDWLAFHRFDELILYVVLSAKKKSNNTVLRNFIYLFFQ